MSNCEHFYLLGSFVIYLFNNILSEKNCSCPVLYFRVTEPSAFHDMSYSSRRGFGVNIHCHLIYWVLIFLLDLEILDPSYLKWTECTILVQSPSCGIQVKKHTPVVWQLPWTYLMLWLDHIIPGRLWSHLQIRAWYLHGNPGFMSLWWFSESVNKHLLHGRVFKLDVTIRYPTLDE